MVATPAETITKPTTGDGHVGQSGQSPATELGYDPHNDRFTKPGEIQTEGTPRDAFVAQLHPNTPGERSDALAAVRVGYTGNTGLHDMQFGMHDKNGEPVQIDRKDGKVDYTRQGPDDQPASFKIDPNGKTETFHDGTGDSMTVNDGTINVHKVDGTPGGENITVTPSEVRQKVDGVDVRYERAPGAITDPQPDTIDSKVGTDGKTKVVAHTAGGTDVEAKQDGQYKVTNNGGDPTTYSYDANAKAWTQTDSSGAHTVSTKPDDSGNISVGDNTYLTSNGKMLTLVNGKYVELDAQSDHAQAKVLEGDGSAGATVRAQDTRTTTTAPGATPGEVTATQVETQPKAGEPAVLSVSGTPQDVQAKFEAAQSGQPVQMAPGDFALNPGSNGSFNAQMGPLGTGGDFQLTYNPSTGGYDYTGGIAFGNGLDAYGNPTGTSFDNGDANYTGDGTYTTGDGTNNYDSLAAAATNVVGAGVTGDLSAGWTDLSGAAGEVANINVPGAVGFSLAQDAVSQFEAAESVIAGLSPAVQAKVASIIASLTAGKTAALAVEAKALERTSAA